MHILLIHQYFLADGEGGGARWNETTRIWKKMGHEVTVFTGNHHYLRTQKQRHAKNTYEKRVNSDGITVVTCPVYISAGKTFLMQRLLEYLSFSMTVICYGLFRWRQKPDIIIATSPPLTVTFAALFLSWWKKCPYVSEVRDLWPESAIDMKVLSDPRLIYLAYQLESIFYRQAKLIVVLTPAFKNFLIDRKKVPEEKIIYVPNSVDFSLAETVNQNTADTALRNSLNLQGKFVIVYVGAHGRANGLETLLAVAERIKELPVVFLLIGDGDCKAHLIEQTSQSGLNNIQFLDLMPKEEVLKYIWLSDMGLTILQNNPTFKTIYSNKTFDYFSCRKPVLMAVDGVSKALIEQADAGVYIDSENMDAWFSTIMFYIQHPETAKRQGENGYRFAKKHFDRVYWAEVYLDRIEKLNYDGKFQNY